MSKFCFKCGKELDDSAVFCSGCGTNQQTSNTTDTNTVASSIDSASTILNSTTNVQQNTTNYTTSKKFIDERNIVMSIILTFITCGIYGIYWYYSMTNDANIVNEETDSTSGGLTILYTIITCGLYRAYWGYKVGKQLYNAGLNNGKNISDNSILYLILTLFGFSIISDALIQSDLNSFSN